MTNPASKKAAAKKAANSTVRQALLDSPITVSSASPDPKGKEMLDSLSKEPQVIVLVPTAFTLQLDGHVPLKVLPGQQRMARSLAEHWWSKANGVTIFED